MTSAPVDTFRAARDELLALRRDHGSADAAFSWPDVGTHFNWATDWFDAIAGGNDAIALWIVEEDGREQKVSFAAMAERSDRVATWLARQGVRQGEHVMLMLGNQVELWETMLAVMKLGAVILPTTTLLGTDDLRDRVERGAVRHVIANREDTSRFAAVAGDYTRISVGGAPAAGGWIDYADSADASAARPDVVTASTDACLIYFTSGTTSKPKMVVHTQASYPVGHLSTMYWIGLQPGDVHLTISSPGWGKHAWSCFFAPWIAEATVFVYNAARFDPVRTREILDANGVTTFCAPPTAWRMLIKADLGARPRALREALSAGEPLNPHVIDSVKDAWGLTIRDGYGQTETTAIIGNSPGDTVRPGSMGRPLPGVTVVLVDPLTGERGDDGEICLDLDPRPLNLMQGYLGAPEKTDAATRDGLFHTGDLAVRDADGNITFVGRTDDVFKSSDFKVSPFEVESVLVGHPLVAEAAVVPAPDATRLNIVKAYVALVPGAEATEETARAIFAYTREHLSVHERVRRLEFFDLPKTISGKIRRVELRDRENAAALADADLPDEWREERTAALDTGRA